MQTYILTIAGSDSSSGAGIQADIKTAQALGAYATSAVTCVTAQSTAEFAAVQPVDPELIASQIRTVVADLPIAAVKVGMLGSVAAANAVADELAAMRAANPKLPIVIDPVLHATTGGELDAERVGRAICERLLPLATVVTPNFPEARALADRCRVILSRRSVSGGMSPAAPSPASDKDIASWASRILIAAGAEAVLVKGGHGSNAQEVTDYLFVGEHSELGYVSQLADDNPDFEVRLTLPRQDERVCVPVTFKAQRQPGEFHGTGCVLSTAIAVGLGQRKSLPDAVHLGHGYLAGLLQRPLPFGHGSNLLDHHPQ